MQDQLGVMSSLVRVFVTVRYCVRRNLRCEGQRGGLRRGRMERGKESRAKQRVLIAEDLKFEVFPN